jgi:WD40 repeat protein
MRYILTSVLLSGAWLLGNPGDHPPQMPDPKKRGLVPDTELRHPRETFRHKAEVKSVQFIDDGARFLSSSSDGFIWLWDRNGNKSAMRARTDQLGLYVAAKSSSKRCLSIDTDGNVSIWNLDQKPAANIDSPAAQTASHPALVRSIQVRDCYPLGIAYTPDDRFVGVTSLFEGIILLDAETGQVARRIGSKSSINAIAFSPDSKTVAGVDKDGKIMICDVKTGNELKSFSIGDSASSIDFSGDGNLIAVAGSDSCVNIFETNTGKKRHHLVGHSCLTSNAKFVGEAQVVSSAVDGTVIVWELSSGTVQQWMSPSKSEAVCLAVSRSRREVLVGTHDGGVFVYGLPTAAK